MTAGEFQAAMMEILSQSESGNDALNELTTLTAGHEPWASWVADMEPAMLQVGCELMDTWGVRTPPTPQ